MTTDVIAAAAIFVAFLIAAVFFTYEAVRAQRQRQRDRAYLEAIRKTKRDEDGRS